MGRWQRYWFADGGRVAAAIVRIALGVAVLLCLRKLAAPTSNGDLPGEHTLYRPVGVWMLLGHSPPPAALVGALWVVAWGATTAMVLGLASRAATALSFVAAVALAALSFSASKTWSHQYNVVFLAQLAFLGARGGDALSLDAVIRRARHLPPRVVVRGYQWSLRLVQLAVALMFFGAACHKLMHGHFTLRWALSDNLRHHLLMQFDLAGLPRPPVADWVIAEPWRYQGAALLNLISQWMPLAACFLVARPRWRALAGAFFVIETLALGLVVDLWNLHWLPLYAVFVDWDAAAAWLRRAPTLSPEVAPVAPIPPPRAAAWFVIAFVTYDALTAFIPTLDQRLNTYPFSGFPMFATIRVRAPYDAHLPYDVVGDHFVITADAPVNVYEQRWFDHTNRGVHELRDPARLRAKLAAVFAQADRRYPGLHLQAIRHELTIFEAPPYPAPAHFEAHPVAVLGTYRRDGGFATVLGQITDAGATLDVELRPVGVDATHARLGYVAEDDATFHELAAERRGDRFACAHPAGALYVIAVVTDAAGGETRWLVGSLARPRWQ